MDFGDTGGTADEDDFMNLTLAGVSILEDILDRWHALAEMWEAEFFELGTGDVDVEVFTFCEGLTVDFGLMGS